MSLVRDSSYKFCCLNAVKAGKLNWEVRDQVILMPGLHFEPALLMQNIKPYDAIDVTACKRTWRGES